MAKGTSLHIGLNKIDKKHYGTDGALAACEADANDMYQIAKDAGFRAKKLLTPQGTREAVISGIQAAAKSLTAGDMFFISYAGHGSQVPDRNSDEDDGRDETWCLYDGMLIDDELKRLWTTFKAGVRILVLSDSCHSGTVVRALPGWTDGMNDNTGYPADLPAYRFLPTSVSFRAFRANKTFYEAIIAELAKKLKKPAEMKADLLLISGCQDNQTSADGRHNGLFTGTLLSVWNEGQFSGDYAKLHRRIVSLMPARQTPNLMTMGPNPERFKAQRPFEIK
jgi:hypothetical protein